MKEITQPVEQELELEVLEPQPVEQNPFATNPDYKQCRTCGEHKHSIDGYYHHGKSKKTSYLDCIKCCNQRETNRKRIGRQEELEQNGGSEKVSLNPNTYRDIYQQQQTFELMKLLGYTYDDSGVWLKPGVKELIDGKLVFKNLKKRKYIASNKIDYTHEMWKEIYNLYNSGRHSYVELSEKYKVSTTTICHYIKRVRNGK